MDAAEVPGKRHDGELSTPTLPGEAGKIHSAAVTYQLSSYVDYRCKSAQSKGCVMPLV